MSAFRITYTALATSLLLPLAAPQALAAEAVSARVRKAVT